MYECRALLVHKSVVMAAEAVQNSVTAFFTSTSTWIVIVINH